ncbi:hypothetical protein ACLOJK_032766 [Asimina triloba]
MIVIFQRVKDFVVMALKASDYPQHDLVSLWWQEVDIWSYGCVLLEMLTLQVPYAGLPESEIHRLLQSSQRPPLRDDVEAQDLAFDSATSSSATEARKFLFNLFHECTEGNPADRPTAREIHDKLCCYISSRWDEAGTSSSKSTD